MATVTFRGSREDLRRVLSTIPSILAGREPDTLGIARAVQYRAGAVALSCIQSAFVVKARGGVDDAGIKWAPLTREYVAYGRRHPGLNAKRKAAAAKGRPGRPLLTNAQDDLWRRTFARAKAARMRAGDSEAEAKAVAGGAAWNVVKRAGGQTIIGTYGGASVEVGRDTGALLASLTPGVHGPGTDPAQVFKVAPGEVIVGSNKPYAIHFHRRRPLWPLDGSSLPAAWWKQIAAAAATGLAEALAVLIGRGLSR